MGDFIAAVDAGDDAAVRRFLEHEGADANTVKPSGWPLIVSAADYGYAATVGVLIEHKADLEATANGFTALVQASMGGHTATVGVLLEHKADPGRRSRAV